MGLIDGINDPNKKAKVVDDCVRLIDEQVAAKSGLSGLAMKAGFATVKGVMPNYIASSVEWLVPEVFIALDPIWSEGIQAGDPVGYLIENRSRSADALLGITDARIQKSKKAIVRGTYDKFRNSAKSDVEEAIPGLAKIIDNYTKS